MKNLDDLKLPASDGKRITGSTKIKILRVVELIRSGYSKTRIVEELQKSEGVKARQAERYYQCAAEYLSPSENEQDELRLSVISTLQGLVEKSITEGDKQNALKSIDLLNKVGGLYNERVDLNVSGGLNFGFKFDTGGLEDGGEEDN